MLGCAKQAAEDDTDNSSIRSNFSQNYASIKMDILKDEKNNRNKPPKKCLTKKFSKISLMSFNPPNSNKSSYNLTGLTNAPKKRLTDTSLKIINENKINSNCQTRILNKLTKQ